MEAVLPNGRFKVVGVMENPYWRERYEAQKAARAERRREKEARAQERQEAKEARAQERLAAKEARANEKLQAKIRKNLLTETYKMLGMPEDHIEQQKAWIAEQEAKNRYANGNLSAADHLKRTQSIAAGAGRAAGADKRGKKEIVLDFIGDAVGEGSFKGLAKKVGTLGGAGAGMYFFGSTGVAFSLGATAVTLGAAALGGIIGGLCVTVPLALISLTRKGKSMEGNLADHAEKLDTYKQELAEFETKINNLVARFEADQPMLMEKSKSMKKGEFNTYLSSYISSLLSEYGLTQADIQKAAENINGQEQEEKKEGEEPEQETPEEKAEDEKTEEKEEQEDKQEQQTQVAVEEARKREEERKQAEEVEESQMGDM